MFFCWVCLVTVVTDMDAIIFVFFRGDDAIGSSAVTKCVVG